MSILNVKGQRKNERRFPGIRGKRPDKASFRREEAAARQAEYDQLSLEQKIARLPPEPFAAKQRLRLLKHLAKQSAPVKDETPQSEAAESNKQQPKKNTKGK
jgi:hypothetical protein